MATIRQFFIFVVVFSSLLNSSYAEKGGEQKNLSEEDKTYIINTITNDITKNTQVIVKKELENIKEKNAEIAKLNISSLSELIKILTIVIAVFIFAVGIFQFISSKREHVSFEKSNQTFKEYLGKSLEDTKNELRNNFDKFEKNYETVEKLSKENIKNEVIQHFGENIENIMNFYESQFLLKINVAERGFEERFSKAESVRYKLWKETQKKYMYSKNVEEIIPLLSNFFKANNAFMQMLSPKAVEVWDGLGIFINLKEAGEFLPESLWELVLLLKKQGRFDDEHVKESARKLCELMGKKFDLDL